MFHIDPPEKDLNDHDDHASFSVARKVIVVDQETTDLLDNTPTFVWSNMCLYCGLSPPLPPSIFPLVSPHASSSSSTTFSSGATINECCSVCFFNLDSAAYSRSSNNNAASMNLMKELESGMKNLGCKRIKRGHQRHAAPDHDQKPHDSVLKKARSAHALTFKSGDGVESPTYSGSSCQLH